MIKTLLLLFSYFYNVTYIYLTGDNSGGGGTKVVRVALGIPVIRPIKSDFTMDSRLSMPFVKFLSISGKSINNLIDI
jgi:hypothetical protein